jgi:hypothetical protein
MNRVTQVLLVIGAFAVVGIVGLGAVSHGAIERASRPKPTPVPLVTFRAPPDGWAVGQQDAVLSLARGPVAGKATVARITACLNAYGVAADGSLTHRLETDATKIAFDLVRRDDLRAVVSGQAATVAGLQGNYLDFTIPKGRRPFVSETDTWLARAEQANCAAVVDTSDAESGVDAAIEVTEPAIVRLGLFALPDGRNLMVLIASEGIGIRAKPDMTDIDEATDIVAELTFHLDAR